MSNQPEAHVIVCPSCGKTVTVRTPRDPRGRIPITPWVAEHEDTAGRKCSFSNRDHRLAEARA